MANDGVNTLTYDVENHVLSASGSYGSGAYTYDGNGLRVQKAVTGGNTTVYIFSGSKVIAEYDNGAAPSSPSREYIYSGAALLAKIDSTGTHYYHQDHLSNRLVTDSSGNNYAELGTFPYGESWYNASGDKLQFTTYERDLESGNDYAQARSYVNRLARFSSLDPLPGDTSDPQTLNRYSYVRNMPVMFADPSGACPATVENIPDGFVEGHGSFVLTRFLTSDSDADPDPQNPSQSCNPDNMNAVGGTRTLDGFDITSQTGGYGGFALGTSGGIGGPVFVSVNVLNIVGCSADAHGCWGYWTTGFDAYDYLGWGSGDGGGPGGGGGTPPGAPGFSRQAYEKCANQAFGSTSGSVAGTPQATIPSYDLALTTFQAGLFTGSNLATLGATLSLERSTTTLYPPNTPEANGTVSYGPANINSANFGAPWAVSGTFGTNLGATQTFNGDPLSNIESAGLLLNRLGNNPQRYVGGGSLAAQRANQLSAISPAFQAFFDCLKASAFPM